MVFLYVFASMLSPASFADSGRVLDKIEATVNADIVLKSDIANFKKNLELRSQLDPLFQGSTIAKNPKNLADRDIVDFLISEKIILGDFPVSDSEVENEIQSIQSNNRIDRKTLRTAIEAQGFHFKDYFELIRISISKRALVDRDVRTKVHVSDDDVKNNFYNEKRTTTNTALSYRIKIITVDPKNYKSAGAAKETLSRALQDIQAGEPFEDVAKRMSDDPSKSHGGDLGYLPIEELSPALKGAVKKLKLGQISDIFGNEKSAFFVVKLADIKSEFDSELSKSKERIRAELTAKEFQRQIELWIEKRRQASFVHYSGDSLVAKKNAPQ